MIELKCTSGEEWYRTLFLHYDKDLVIINHNKYSDSFNALVSTARNKTVWIGKYSNQTQSGVVVDRRDSIRTKEDQ